MAFYSGLDFCRDVNELLGTLGRHQGKIAVHAGKVPLYSWHIQAVVRGIA